MSLEYHNLMEDIVLQEVDAIMRSGGGCRQSALAF